MKTYIIKSDRNHYEYQGKLSEAKASARENSYTNGWTGVYEQQTEGTDRKTYLVYAAENGKISHKKEYDKKTDDLFSQQTQKNKRSIYTDHEGKKWEIIEKKV